MSNSRVCAVKLGPAGLQYTYTNDALIEFQETMSKSLVGGLVMNPDVKRAAEDRLRTKRFFDCSDHTLDALDNQQAADPRSPGKWLSITRDMMTGPTWDEGHSQGLFAADGSDVPFMNPERTDPGIDADCFVREVSKLRDRGILKGELPDFDSDESMLELFGKVHDEALNEAQSKRISGGTKNRVIDNAPGMYLFSELLHRTNILIEEDFTELWARRIFSIRNLNTWMPQWVFRRQDVRGVLPSWIDVERLPGRSKRGSENRTAEPRNLAFMHHGATWSKIELMRWAEAQATNGALPFAIDKSRIDTAVRMMNFREDLTVFFGDDAVDIPGLFTPESKTGVERVPAGGKFGVGSTEDDRALLTREVKAIRLSTETVLQPDTIMLPLEAFDYIVDAPYGDNTNSNTSETVESMALKSLTKLGIKDILMVPEMGYNAAQEARLIAHGLSAAQAKKYAGGDGGLGLQDMVVCNRQSHVMEMVVAKDRIMYPSQTDHNDRVETRMLQGCGGLAIFKPKGVKIVTDIGPS